MKTKSIIIQIAFVALVISFFSFTGFVNDSAKESNDLTKNTQLKNNVFNQIINNRELFNEFMNEMMNNNQSMNWMMNNQGMMKYMFSGNNLGYMMHHNPNLNHMMMQNMMNTIQSDSTYCYQWNHMMNDHTTGMHHGNMMMMHN